MLSQPATRSGAWVPPRLRSNWDTMGFGDPGAGVTRVGPILSHFAPQNGRGWGYLRRERRLVPTKLQKKGRDHLVIAAPNHLSAMPTEQPGKATRSRSV